MRKRQAGVALTKAAFHMLLLFCLLTTMSCAMPKIIVLNDPLSPEEHVNLGLAYEKKGEIEGAIREYKTAARDIPTAYLYLGNIYYAEGEYPRAEKYYRKAISKKPDLADSYNNLAWLLYVSGGDLREARRLAEKATELDPSNDHYRDTVQKIDEKMQTGFPGRG
jgi:tetratricopeptide (TPR) repeat protein